MQEDEQVAPEMKTVKEEPSWIASFPENDTVDETIRFTLDEIRF